MVCGQKALRERYIRDRENKLAIQKKYYEINKKTISEKQKKIRASRELIPTTYNIIKQHHEAMKDDPEHLTTEFIKKLIKVDCKDV